MIFIYYCLEYDDDTRSAAYLLHVFLDAKISESTANKMILAFSKITHVKIMDYKNMIKSILSSSCIRLCLRCFVRCEYCRRLVDSPLLFCPYCLNKDRRLSRLYYSCGSKACCCSNVDEIRKERLSDNEVREFMHYYCFHLSKKPCNEYVYYLPIVALIGDWIHSGLWCGFRSLTNENVMESIEYCKKIGMYSIFIGENASNIYNFCNRKDVALACQIMNKACLFDNDITESSKQIVLVNEDSDSFKYFIFCKDDN